jgi:hypothetical protein
MWLRITSSILATASFLWELAMNSHIVAVTSGLKALALIPTNALVAMKVVTD